MARIGRKQRYATSNINKDATPELALLALVFAIITVVLPPLGILLLVILFSTDTKKGGKK